MTHNDLSRPVKEFATQVHTTLHEDQTIEEALISLRRRKIDEKIIYFYVVDDDRCLKGIVSTRQLLLNERHCTIKEIMTHSVIRLKEDQTLEEAMELLSKPSAFGPSRRRLKAAVSWHHRYPALSGRIAGHRRCTPLQRRLSNPWSYS